MLPGIFLLLIICQFLTQTIQSAFSMPSVSISAIQVSYRSLYKVRVEHKELVTENGIRRRYTIYWPDVESAQPGQSSFSRGPFPVVILIHGFFMSGIQHSNNAKYFAERGFIAVTPDMTRLLLGDQNRKQNVQYILSEISSLIKQNNLAGSPLHGLIDKSHIGIAGSSAGGAVCLELLAEAQKQNIPINAMCSLDGVPWDKTWDKMAKLQRVNILSLRAEPGICNYHARMLGYLSLLKFHYDDVKVNGAHHCDVENPTTVGCKCICGKSDVKHRLIFQRLTYLYFRDKFHAPTFEATNDNFVTAVRYLENRHEALADLSQSQPTALAIKQQEQVK